MDHPQGSNEVDEEFGKGLTAPTYGWTSLLRTLELAVAAGPLILFNTKKLSNNHISRARLTSVSEDFLIQIIFLTESLALGATGKGQESLCLVGRKNYLARPDQDISGRPY